MMRALQLTAGCALVRVRITKRVVGPTVVPAGFGDFILWDSHVATYVLWVLTGSGDRVNFVLCVSFRGALGHNRHPVET